jgi:DNA-binding CsgD family transcriptional regulator
MEHINLLYLFITFVTGIVSLGIVGFLYVKTHDALIGYYLAFYAVFTLLIVLNVLTAYIEINIPEASILPILKFFLSTVARFALMFVVPVFINHLCNVSHAKARMQIFGALAILMAVTYQILEVVPNDVIEEIGDIIVDAIFMAAMFYALIVGIATIGKLREAVRERLLRKFLMLFGSFLPGLFMDTLLSEFFSIPVQIFPILYCGCSVVFTHHFLKYYTAQPVLRETESCTSSESTVQDAIDSSAATFQNTSTLQPSKAAFFMQYDISPREQEVVRLIVQGCSNQQIGDILFISINTVKAHVKKIYAKCGVNSRYELMAMLNSRSKG